MVWLYGIGATLVIGVPVAIFLHICYGNWNSSTKDKE